MLPPRVTAAAGRGLRAVEEYRYDSGFASGTNLTVTELKTMMRDEGALVSVTMGEVVVRKVVYGDGRFHAQIEEGRDRIAFAGSQGRASLTYGSETVALVPCAHADAVARAREVVGNARVISTFRRIAERMNRTRRTSACSVSVRLTAALVAEVAGELAISAQLTSLASAPMPHYRLTCDGGDGFRERWTELAIRRLPILQLPGSTGQTSPQLSTLDAAFQVLLTLEAAWYTVAARVGDTPSHAVR